MYLVKTPLIAPWIFPTRMWRVKTSEPVVYVSFDDGPDPEVTPDILDLLKEFDAKATFFVVGEKVANNPELFQRIQDNGHTVGNHTYNHLNGIKTNDIEYLSNVKKASSVIPSGLFRPPYGQIRMSQAKAIQEEYRLVMWSVLTGDFEEGISTEKVLNRAIRHTIKGSIVVFHDNRKFREVMLPALRGFLDHFQKKGYRFEALVDPKKSDTSN